MGFQMTDAQRQWLQNRQGTTQPVTPQPVQPVQPQQPGPQGFLPPTQQDIAYLAKAMGQHTAQADPMKRFEQVQSAIPQVQRGETLDWDEAHRRSMAQYQPTFDKQLAAKHKAQERDAIKRGFFGQLPTEALKSRATGNAAEGLATAAAASANDMVSRSEQMAEQRYQFDTQTRQQNVQMLQGMFQHTDAMVQQGFQNLKGLMEYSTKVDDMKWQREQQAFLNAIQEASVTGMYKGNMTADMQRFMAEMGFKRETFEWTKTMDQANLALAQASLAARSSGGSSSGGLKEQDITQITAKAFAYASGEAGKIEDHLPTNALGRKDTSPNAWIQAERKHQELMDYYTNQYYTRIYGGLMGESYDQLGGQSAPMDYKSIYSPENTAALKQNSMAERLANSQSFFDQAFKPNLLKR